MVHACAIGNFRNIYPRASHCRAKNGRNFIVSSIFSYVFTSGAREIAFRALSLFITQARRVPTPAGQGRRGRGRGGGERPGEPGASFLSLRESHRVSRAYCDKTEKLGKIRVASAESAVSGIFLVRGEARVPCECSSARVRAIAIDFAARRSDDPRLSAPSSSDQEEFSSSALARRESDNSSGRIPR